MLVLPIPWLFHAIYTCPRNVRRQPNSQWEGKCSHISWISTTNESVLGLENHAAFLSPAKGISTLPLWISISPSCPRPTFLEFLRGVQDAERCHLEPHLSSPEVNPHFLYRASPFCQHRKWKSQPGYSKCALSGCLLEHSWTQGGNQGNWPQCPASF